ncbi:hypothetical protein HZS_5859 [Henneguya salminicola]|nr:hypothetical protein HZS_5859 [Henneguya salminicola]
MSNEAEEIAGLVPVPENDDEQDNFKVPEPKKISEILEADKEDESLNLYKKKLLGDSERASRNLKITFKKIELVTHDNQTLVYEINQSVEQGQPCREIVVDKKQEVCKKKPFSCNIFFTVDDGYVYSLVCNQRVYKNIICVEKEKYMIGAYAASDDVICYHLFKDMILEGPLVRGTFNIVSHIKDKDNKIDVKITTKLKISK